MLFLAPRQEGAKTPPLANIPFFEIDYLLLARVAISPVRLDHDKPARTSIRDPGIFIVPMLSLIPKRNATERLWTTCTAHEARCIQLEDEYYQVLLRVKTNYTS